MKKAAQAAFFVGDVQRFTYLTVITSLTVIPAKAGIQ
jgi:hypothetical protein